MTYKNISMTDMIKEQVPTSWDEVDARLPEDLVLQAKANYDAALESQITKNSDLMAKLRDMPFDVSERTASICTDNEKIWINPQWWTQRSPSELEYCINFIACMMKEDFLTQGKKIVDLDKMRWEMASNHVINRKMINSGVTNIPGEHIYLPSIDPDSALSVEDIYEILKGMTDEEMFRTIRPQIADGNHDGSQ